VAKLPSLNARKVVRALNAPDSSRTGKGSHLILIHPETKVRIVVLVHAGRTIKEPLLRAIVRDAKLSLDEFVELL
jgi:predicted RNA binding protein YcfA (HicA-like mRNA interferase family)